MELSLDTPYTVPTWNEMIALGYEVRDGDSLLFTPQPHNKEQWDELSASVIYLDSVELDLDGDTCTTKELSNLSDLFDERYYIPAKILRPVKNMYGTSYPLGGAHNATD